MAQRLTEANECAFRERNEAELARLLQTFRKHKLDAIPVETGGSYEKAIIQFFKLRARRL